MVNLKLHLLLTLLFLFLSAGCQAHKNNIYESPKKQTYIQYSDLARVSHLSLANDGYIIGIEKRGRDSLGGIPEQHYPDRLSMISEKNVTSEREKLIHKRNSKFNSYTKYGTAMLVTHIASYFDAPDGGTYNEFREPHFLYNAYETYKSDNLNYEDGYEKLETLKDSLVKDLEGKIDDWWLERESQARSSSALDKRPYSHIVIFSMGWNNNQQESIYRYNTILDNVKNVAEKNNNNDFRPLVIGFTWPSVWFGIENSWLKKNTAFISSYFTKQDDADEIGFTIANWVVHNVVLKAKDEVKEYCKDNGKRDLSPEVITIGHSMGARILSRAIFSRDYIKYESPKRPPESHVKLFIGLQGAFSANRFVVNRGWEGYPYAEFYDYPTSFTLTTSLYDKANPAARFFTGAKHVGGKYGLKFAMKEKNENIFKVIKWTDNYRTDLNTLSSIARENERRVIMIDASKIVDGYDVDHRVNNPNDAHNDILDTDMAELICALIVNFADYSNKN